MSKQMENFSFSFPNKLDEEEKWLLSVTAFEKTNSVFTITDENHSFSVSTPSYLSPKDGE